MLILKGKLFPYETIIYVCQNNFFKITVNSLDNTLKQLVSSLSIFHRTRKERMTIYLMTNYFITKFSLVYKYF